MFDLPVFIDECKRALREADGIARVKDLLHRAVQDVAGIEAALPPFTDDETLLHACDDMTIVALRLTPNVHYPPHEHRMPAVIGLYRGTETNFFYRESGAVLRTCGAQSMRAPAVYNFDDREIHSVVNLGEDYSCALHVYCGDLIHQPRFIWDPGTYEQFPYSDETYFRLARPFDGSRPFLRPRTPTVHADAARPLMGPAT